MQTTLSGLVGSSTIGTALWTSFVTPYKHWLIVRTFTWLRPLQTLQIYLPQSLQLSFAFVNWPTSPTLSKRIAVILSKVFPPLKVVSSMATWLSSPPTVIWIFKHLGWGDRSYCLQLEEISPVKWKRWFQLFYGAPGKIITLQELRIIICEAWCLITYAFLCGIH